MSTTASVRKKSRSSANRNPSRPYGRSVSCIGFGASFLGTLLFGVTLDQFGGTSQLAAWVLSFGACGLACLAGAAATIFLPRNIWQR